MRSFKPKTPRPQDRAVIDSVIRCTTARVDLKALESNFNAISSYLHKETGFNREAGRGPALAPGIIAVVKANAYGHGARRVAAALQSAGAIMLAVADIEEGVDLRKSGIHAPILVFGALSVSDLDGVFDHDLTPTISSPAAGHALQEGAAKRGATLRYHLKIDTLFDIRDREHDRAGGLQRGRDAARAVSVGVGLDDGNDPRRQRGSAAGLAIEAGLPVEIRADGVEVGFEGVEINARRRAADHNDITTQG